METILVSACLTGASCRYDGRSRPDKKLLESLRGRRWILVCPEQLAGQPTPREKTCLTGGDGRAVIAGQATVKSESGRDLTEALLLAAEVVCELASRCGAARAYLKENSPSCGVARVEVDGEKVRGMGVTAAALKARGIEVIGVD
ncbi:MAG: DUF523 domain-containing protein [Phycisphaerae bacterium]|jgi:uncharacterized protein YbbK (DUF523 family)|nr:DUF523 domain-containing protein [Phycisphaerae bacterium]